MAIGSVKKPSSRFGQVLFNAMRPVVLDFYYYGHQKRGQVVSICTRLAA